MNYLKLFYEEQLDLLATKNGAALVEAHYADNAEMIVIADDEPIIAKGKVEITKLFDYYLNNVYQGFISTEKYADTKDSIMFEATIKTANGPLKVYDSLYLENGKIIRHFSGVK